MSLETHALIVLLAAALPDFSPATCVPDSATLCLNNDRFLVRADWEVRDGRSGSGQKIRLTRDTGYFWFFDESNVEVIIKVLDGCDLNGHFWVFAAGLTDVEVQLQVRDTQAERSLRFVNPQGTAFQPIQSISAFATCEVEVVSSYAQGIADRARRSNFRIAVEQTSENQSGRAQCNADLSQGEWRRAMILAEDEGPSHERWRLCTCPQVEGECAAEAEAARDQLQSETMSRTGS